MLWIYIPVSLLTIIFFTTRGQKFFFGSFIGGLVVLSLVFILVGVISICGVLPLLISDIFMNACIRIGAY